MLNEYQSVDGLIAGVKGTAGFLSSLFSRKSGLVIVLLVLGVVVSKLLFS